MKVNKYIAYAIISVCLLLAAFLTSEYLSGDSVGLVRFMINFLLRRRRYRIDMVFPVAQPMGETVLD